MQDCTLQRSYVKQAASRKNALNLREYPTPNRHNNINNNNVRFLVKLHYYLNLEEQYQLSH